MTAMKDVIDRLNSDIFSNDSENELEQNCRKREITIKRNIKRSFEFIDIHQTKPDFEGKLNHWQKHKVERNIQNHIDYIELLYSSSSKEKIEDFCKTSDLFLPLTVDRNELIYFHNSFFGSVVTDILWSSDITVADNIRISHNNLDYSDLEKKLPSRLRSVNGEVLPFLKSKNDYVIYYQTLLEAVQSYKRKYFKACNLLVMTTIEGMVRTLGDYLIIKQNLDKGKLDNQYNSLDSYLRNIPWKADFEIDSTHLSMITGDFKLFEGNEIRYKEKCLINLKTRLDFLRRRFKHDRNMILHGLGNDYGKPWHLYINFAALYEVYLTIKYYLDKYE